MLSFRGRRRIVENEESPDERSESPLPQSKTVIMRVIDNDSSQSEELTPRRASVSLLSRLHEVVLGPLTRAQLCHEFKITKLATSYQIDMTVPYDLELKPQDKEAWQTCLNASIFLVSDGQEIRHHHRWSEALPSINASMEINLSFPEPTPKVKKKKKKKDEYDEDYEEIEEDENEDEYSQDVERETCSAANTFDSPGESVISGTFQNYRPVGCGGGEGVSCVLKSEMCDALWHYLPIELKWKKWRLAYKVALHGVSFQTFFNNLEDQGPTVVVVEDESGAIFGGFAATSWEKKPDRYFGTGDSFVFKWKEKVSKENKAPPPLAHKILEQSQEFSARFANDHKGRIPNEDSLDAYREELKADYRRTEDLTKVNARGICSATEALDVLDSEGEEEQVDELEVFNWKEELKAPFFQFFDGTSLAFGGGEMPAFYLEDEFIRGGSGPCLTYGSPMLSGKTEFIVKDCECWRFE